MGSTSYVTKPKSAGYRVKSGSSAGSDKEMNGKLKRTKIRRPTKMNEYGLKRIPDYTEMAYKEAVSKLRYFLSGNYAPSVRSYGGSASIKNLDESDGDMDKKYNTYSPLAEYKPRARLTAKYTTLYADSLNNYAQQNTAIPTPAAAPAAAPADVTGATNPDVVHFIQKQEEYIEQLERESQYCRDELNNLLGKVKEVISENENLHEAQKNKLISRMFHSYNAGSESDDIDELGDSTGLDSDNKMTPLKSRKSKTRSTKLEGPNIVFESRIAELEAQLTQSSIDLKKLQEENNENKRKLASGLVDSTCLDGFKRQIDNLQRDKSSLEAQISKLKLSLDSRDDDGRYKRGSDAVEHQLREERNNLESEVRRLKEDLSKERNKLRELAGEGTRRAIQERSAAEQRYNAHFDELQHDLAAQYDNVAKLQLDLERQRREENELKREISMKNSAIEELKMELKNKTSTLQADLAQAHAEKASFEEELASARLAIERHQRQAKHETNRLNSEIQSLRQRLDRADADLVHSRRENLRLSDQISNLEKELNMKNLTPVTPEKNKKEKELSTMLESMENKHAKTVTELESMIHTQNSLMEKLTGECRLLTDKLDDANRRHKEELATLQRQVNTLSLSLPSAHTPSTYQAHPSHSTSSDRNVPSPPPNAGRDYTGAESTRDTADEPISRLGPVEPDNEHYETTGLTEDTIPIYEQPEPETQVADSKDISDIQNNEKDIVDTNQYEREKIIEEPYVEKHEEEPEIPMEVEHTEPYEAQDYQYDQNYEQPPTEDAQYQNQYENYEQPYNEQYEQYPQQYTEPADPNVQYTEQADPNVQYDQQYQNYATDGNYQGEQNFDQGQYVQEYQENQNVEGYQEQTSDQDDRKVSPQSYDTSQNYQEQENNEGQIASEQNSKMETPNNDVPNQS